MPFTGIKYVHNVVQPSSSSSISRTYSSSQTETLYWLNSTLHSSPPSPGNLYSISVSTNLTISRYLIKVKSCICPLGLPVSLTVMVSRFIHVEACVQTPCSSKAEYYCTVWLTFNHPSTDGHSVVPAFRPLGTVCYEPGELLKHAYA